MNKLVFSVIGSIALLAQATSAQTVLFTTTNDFDGWSGSPQFIASSTTVTDLDNATISGLGNLTAAGSSGTPGALALTQVSGAFDYVFSQGESGNAPFLAALENATGLKFQYTTPALQPGNYYQLGIALNFSGNFWQFFPSSTTTSNGVTTAVFDQSNADFTNAIAALFAQDAANGGGGIGYCQIGIVYNSDYTNDTFYVDNILILTTNAPVTNPPPVLSIQKASPGLNLFASVPGNAGQRQNIETVNSYPWLGDPGVTKYSLTITNFPGTNNSGFQAQIFLISGAPGTESAADFNETNVMFLQIVNNTDGSATALFMFKTNAPNSFPYFASGILASIQSPQVVGTWTLNFQSDTNITLTTPANTTTNFSISPDIANQFAGSLFAYFGIQPNTTNTVGLSAIFSRVQITNSFSQLNEQFATAPLDPTVWQVPALDPNGIIVAPPGSVYWLSWTLPNGGFGLQTSPVLTDPNSWFDPGLVIYPGEDRTRAVVPTNALPSSITGFYRLIKQ